MKCPIPTTVEAESARKWSIQKVERRYELNFQPLRVPESAIPEAINGCRPVWPLPKPALWSLHCHHWAWLEWDDPTLNQKRFVVTRFASFATYEECVRKVRHQKNISKYVICIIYRVRFYNSRHTTTYSCLIWYQNSSILKLLVWHITYTQRIITKTTASTSKLLQRFKQLPQPTG